MIWYTCLDCPPHTATDHSMYRTDGERGRGKCLRDDCSCKTYNPDLSKPPDKRTPRPDVMLNYLPKIEKEEEREPTTDP